MFVYLVLNGRFEDMRAAGQLLWECFGAERVCTLCQGVLYRTEVQIPGDLCKTLGVVPWA